ncbi:protocatechuate 3,4-dioxygenase subunit beta [uncultured Thalassospira sp.]|jgi:protocatechuate 3,4-dioxygenase beta subunit|uniref:protocatechuate 3,4-dioxygenase subunit beta n=1 Tax=uncultured Thalassospira sp. TaxID=404382 RepID=UPI0030D8A406
MTGFKPRDWNSHAPYIAPGYKSTILRGPTKPLVAIKPGLSEGSGPVFARAAIRDLDWDLTQNGCVNGAPIGERIVVHGRVIDGDGRPVPNTVIEVWQANASGRYVHKIDQHNAPLDPNFRGSGRCMSDENGHYVFYTIKPGAYPWGNHFNAWRPNHIHLSLFGPGFATRLVTQMYFPGDPLLDLDPIFLGTPDAEARNRLVAKFSIDKTEEGFALGYQFNIVLRGRFATPMED